MEDINIFKVLDFIRDTAPKYAKAKADRVFIEEYRKTKKAQLMVAAEARGVTSAAGQEREAYANEEYETLIRGLQVAVEIEEKFRWQLEAARLKAEVWRTLESTRRIEGKTL